MLSKEEKEQFLIDRGWETWYNPNYWIHEKTVADPKSQDHTNYGMSLEDAYRYEIENRGPFKIGIGFAGAGAFESTVLHGFPEKINDEN